MVPWVVLLMQMTTMPSHLASLKHGSVLPQQSLSLYLSQPAAHGQTRILQQLMQ